MDIRFGRKCTPSYRTEKTYINGTYVIDQENNTEYHARFKEFFTAVQKEDQICAAGVMCVKGDRSKGPSQQQDPDLYIRPGKGKDGVIEESVKGISPVNYFFGQPYFNLQFHLVTCLWQFKRTGAGKKP
ncbi:MAG: 4-hydroxyphenylacetate 3-hydroxylase N-terminal domain-containing protein [Bacillota bacterium]